MEKEKTNKIFKLFFITILVILILIFIVIIICAFNKGSNGIGSAGISLDEFEEIEFGMNQFKVDSIVDNDGLWDDDNVYSKACIKLSEENKDHVYTYKYKYIGDKSGYAIIVFSADYSDGVYGLKYPEVISKENFDLK